MVVISYSYQKLDKNWELIGIVGQELQVLSAIHCQQFVTEFIGDPILYPTWEVYPRKCMEMYGIW